jgi:HlyD family secretion protein
MAEYATQWMVGALAVALSLAPLPAFAQSEATGMPAAAVTVAKVARTCFVDTVNVTGQLAPKEEIFVRPEREGLQISQVLAEPGDSITAGQVLVRLASSDGQQTATVTAPVAGVIRKSSAVIGTIASARGEPLFQIIAQGEIELQAGVVPSQLARLAVEQQATVKVVGAAELRGRLRFISPAIDSATQLGSVRVAIADSKGLRAGTFARASIVTGQRCGAAVPLSAVIYSREGAVVQAVREQRVESRRVTLGLFSSSQVEIREGLAEGDMVVQKAGAFLREGDRVRPIAAEAAK